MKFLHVGCGLKRKHQTTQGFNRAEWEEVRFDIDTSVGPDITGSMTDLSAVETGSMNAIFAAHAIGHLYPHEVPVAIAEFRRVLAPDGFLVMTCPDLQSVCRLVADGKLTETIIDSPLGPAAPIDVLYGTRIALAQGNQFMAHRSGFTDRVLTATVKAGGFVATASMRRDAPFHDIWLIATRDASSEDVLRSLAMAHFPLAQKALPAAPAAVSA